MNSEHIFQQFRQLISNWLLLSDEQWKDFASLFLLSKVKAKQVLLSPGQHRYQLYYIYSGILRSFYVDNDREYTKDFHCENSFGGPIANAQQRLSVDFGLEALEDSILLTTDYHRFKSLCEDDPVFDKISLRIIENALIRKEKKLQSLGQKNATERYRDFQKNYPLIQQRIAQYHIASYLGINQVTLSRLRKHIH
ncbi:MAG: Crp/Fnr family transcriptional regulator [Calditrichaeota bacterium]|nr:Crp/Fnr family transcriptional regulator [Calditrichota bacterium]